MCSSRSALSCSLQPASPASGALVGIQDDAWLQHGPGTLESRLDELDRLGVDVVRYTLRWDLVARERPTTARDHADPAYDWRSVDAVLRGLRRHDIQPLVTLYGTPRWANGGLAQNWAPTEGQTFGDFARAAATRYSWARLWAIWNEPNKPQWLRPTSASTYVRKLLNPAYAQIHAVNRTARVGGGMTAPRAGIGGVSPVAWIKAMAPLRPRLDAYAHHPYPGRPQLETPWAPACRTCSTIAMADLERLVTLVHRAARAQANLGDRVRIPDESARPLPRRLADEAGRACSERGAARRSSPASSTC